MVPILNKIIYLIKLYFKEIYKPKNAYTIFEFLHGVYNNEILDTHESLYLLLVDNTNNIKDYYLVTSELGNSATINLNTIVDILIKNNPNGLVLSHNHPSRSDIPSLEDINLTREIIKICDYYGIRFVDHLIYCKTNYFSFAESGWFGNLNSNKSLNLIAI